MQMMTQKLGVQLKPDDEINVEGIDAWASQYKLA